MISRLSKMNYLYAFSYIKYENQETQYALLKRGHCIEKKVRLYELKSADVKSI